MSEKLYLKVSILFIGGQEEFSGLVIFVEIDLEVIKTLLKDFLFIRKEN